MMDLTKSPAQLKASILQDAMMGKLTQQLPEDGDAKDLLAQINAEKDALIKAKKIKKQKALPEIDDDEIPFEIPDNWQWVRLNDIGNWKSGSTPKRSHPEYYGGSINWLKTGDLNDSYINQTSEKITQEGVKDSNLIVNQPGSVLIAMYGATIAKLGILNVESTTNQACCACKTYNDINNKFLFYYLMSQRKNFIALGAGGAQPNISRTKIINYLIPLPPLSEQKRIVEKLDSLLPKVDEFNHSVERLHNLREELPSRLSRSFLQSAMMGKLTKQLTEDGDASELLDQIKTEKEGLVKAKKIKAQKSLPEITADEIPFEIPDNWQWVRLGDIAIINSGHNLNKYISDSGIYLYAKISDMNAPENERNIIKTSNKIDINEYAIPKNSIIFPKIGGAIKTNKRRMIINNETSIDPNTMALTPISDSTTEYLWIYMISLDLSKIQVGTSMPSINKTRVGNLMIPFPPLSEQKRIVNKLDNLFSELKR